MKPDPYAHIRAAMARRLAGTVVKPLPPTIRAISLVNRPKPVTLLCVKSTTLNP